MTVRQVVGLVALLVSGWLAFFADKTPSSDADLLAPTRATAASPSAAAPARDAVRETGAPPGPKNAKPAPPAPATVLALAERPRGPKPDAEHPGAPAFGARSWAPLPPPPPPPAPPRAPPLPFSVLGKQLQAGAWQVYLALGEDTRVARAAAVIDGKYRVESIAPPLIVFTYLPLNERQTLDIGAP
ncbi:MAG: hypothetical protein QE279_02035 [Rhodoferax sp.]|nr:hypothetical protein [Rhodoferax sp.]